MSTRSPPMDKEEFVARARLRHRLRLFERSTEEACAQAGVTLPQYLVLLQVRGRPERDWALVGEIAESLVLRPHTAAELVGRCESAGLVRRERDAGDQRKVRVLLTARGRRVVERVAGSQRGELTLLLDHVREALDPQDAAPATSPPARPKRRAP